MIFTFRELREYLNDVENQHAYTNLTDISNLKSKTEKLLPVTNQYTASELTDRLFPKQFKSTQITDQLDTLQFEYKVPYMKRRCCCFFWGTVPEKGHENMVGVKHLRDFSGITKEELLGAICDENKGAKLIGGSARTFNDIRNQYPYEKFDLDYSDL